MAFVKGWRESGDLSLRAFDIKTQDEEAAVISQKREDYVSFKVEGEERLQDALKGASIVFSIVTADEAHAAARAAAPYIEEGCLFLDCNSCAPGTKKTLGKIYRGGRRSLC